VSNPDATFYNGTISDWVNTIHTMLSRQYDMPKFHTKPAKYEYGAYACILSAILSNISMDDIMSSMRGQLNQGKYVELAHAAWSSNYIH
jgi:hypothetical protein